jgi:phospholipid/cholesterol/gamma-HCH transport system permease protein
MIPQMRIPLFLQTTYILGFFGRILKSIWHFVFKGVASYNVLIMQILFTFVEALGIASLLALGIGAAVDILGLRFLSGLSQEKLIYPLLITIITRELGPLLTAFIIIARSATAIATEVAGMVISHEVEAYISIGIDPLEHICVPRFLGVTISLFLLNVYFSALGLAGSFVVAQFFTPMNASVFFNNLLQVLTIPDIVISLLKSIVFGMIIAISALMQGFAVERASTEVPVAGLKAVSAAFALCIVADILLSAVYYVAMA